MDMQGWIKQHRKELNSPIWNMPPLYLKVWQYLKMMANHKENYIPMSDGSMELIGRGQHLTSYRSIAKGVSYYENKVYKEPAPKTVKKILDWLEKNNMISIEHGRGNREYTKVTLVNYGVYQDCEVDGVTRNKQSGNSEETEREQSRNSQETDGEQTLPINKNDKNEIRMKENEKEASTPTSPRLYPSPIHELLANTNSLTQVSYKTFFENADIREENGAIKIKAENEFSKGAIQKYIPTLEIETNKKIEVI
ncbi:TPA: hypothetical protein I9Z77_001579 [Clostridium perfringens]|nr:hypothetical protein [Clostridium perfringens]